MRLMSTTEWSGLHSANEVIAFLMPSNARKIMKRSLLFFVASPFREEKETIFFHEISLQV